MFAKTKLFCITFILLNFHIAYAIVGGRYAQVNEMETAIYLSYDDCSAVIISKNSYLTAAHCALDWQSLKMRPTMLPGSKQRLFPYFMGGRNAPTPLATVKNVQIHPSYLKSLGITRSIDKTSIENLMAYDLALVTIQEEFPVAPAPIYTGNISPNARIVIVGYGCEHPRESTGGSKKKIALKSITNFEQNVFFNPAIDRNGISYACPGDSGGPVFIQTANTNHWQLVGINRTAGNPLVVTTDPNDLEVLKMVDSVATKIDISFIQQLIQLNVGSGTPRQNSNGGFQGRRF